MKAIIHTIIAVIEHPECAVFSVVTLAGYMVVDVAFAAINGYPFNNQGVSTTLDQDYFIKPLHGTVSHADDIRIFYGANFLPKMDAVKGITFGRLIYVRADSSATTANIPLLGDSAFRKDTKNLLHEFQHVQQYRDVGYINSAFGARYLFDYCTVRKPHTHTPPFI